MTTYLGAKHWKPSVLQDLVFLQRGFDITKAQQKAGDVPVFSSAGLSSWHNEAKAQGPGVIIGRKGTLGSVHYSEGDYWPHDTTLWSKSLRGNCARYVYYALKCLGLERFNVGGANPTLNRNHIHSLPIYIPERSLQDEIVSVLSAYDELIENNRRRIGLLEEAARLLYREWFVHFRFPGHEHVKIIDDIPEGWERVRIRQVLTALESGGRPRGGALEGYGIPSIGAENVIGLGQYNYSKEKYVAEDYFARMRRGVIQSRDVVLYKDGANIGRSSMFGDGFPHSQCAVNEHVFILRADADVGQSHLFFWLAQPETRQSIVNLNANTAQPGISQDKLKTLWFLLPPRVLRHQFNESVEAQVAQIFRLALMNQKLTEARDLLLPRLMNGEIAV